MISYVKEWFDKTFFTAEPFGDKLLSILIGILAIIFVIGWVLLILWLLYHSLFDILKWLKKKDGIPDFDFEDKLDGIKEKIDRLILMPILLPLLLIPSSLTSKIDQYKKQIRLAKTLAIGLIVPILFIIIWLWSSSGPFQELKLIISSDVVDGKIIDAVEGSDVIELYEGRKSEQVFYYDYEYVYRISDNVLRHARGSEKGRLPDSLSSIDLPAHVEVEYIPDDPSVSRVRGMKSNSTTIFEWIRRRMVLPGFIFIFICFLCGQRIHDEYKKYKAGLIENDLIN